MQQSFTLDARAAVVFARPNDNPGVTVKNTGSSDILLGMTPTVTVDNGYPLSPGSSVIWESGRALYLAAVAGGTAFVSDNAGNLFDADAVGASLIRQGLAQEIADSLKIGGVPPIRQQSVILTWDYVTPMDSNVSYYSDYFDVSETDRLDVDIYLMGYNYNDFLEVYVEFSDGPTIWLSHYYYGRTGLWFTVPAEGKLARVVVKYVGTSAFATFTMRVTGTLGAVARNYDFMSRAVLPPPGASVFDGDLTQSLYGFGMPAVGSSDRSTVYHIPHLGKPFQMVIVANKAMSFYFRTYASFGGTIDLWSGDVTANDYTRFDITPPKTHLMSIWFKELALSTYTRFKFIY